MTSRGRLPLAHPFSLTAIAVLVVNDHVLKAAWPGFVTGKLSDVAGLVFFPLLWVALLEPLVGAIRDRRSVAIAASLTAVAFALVKTWPPANFAYAVLGGVLQWPAVATQAWLAGLPLPSRFEVACVRDPSDLLALPAAWVAVWLVPARRQLAPTICAPTRLWSESPPASNTAAVPTVAPRTAT